MSLRKKKTVKKTAAATTTRVKKTLNNKKNTKKKSNAFQDSVGMTSIQDPTLSVDPLDEAANNSPLSSKLVLLAKADGTAATTTEYGVYVENEIKDQNIKYVLSKFEFDLFKDEDNIVNKIIRIKRVPMPNKGEKWKIFEDDKVLFVLEGTKLSLKERSFLHTPQGLNFLIKEFKTGVKSFNYIRAEMKKLIK